LLFEAGAGANLVGASEYSDYPPAARTVPRIGDAFRIDYERVVSLRPDFAVAWQSGTPAGAIARLEALGLRVVVLPVESLGDIAVAIEELGRLAGTSPVAQESARRLRRDLDGLAAGYAGRTPVRVFVQLDDEPLFTVTGRHLISEMVTLCGGQNVFGGLPGLAPAVDLEAVIGADPEAILYTGTNPDPAARWSRWAGLAAVRYGSITRLPPDLVSRATPRVVAGASDVCKAIQRARDLRQAARN
jgi:iron complex transport system substrate-binding protein